MMRYIKVLDFLSVIDKTLCSLIDLYCVGKQFPDSLSLDFKRKDIKELFEYFFLQTIEEQKQIGKKILIFRGCSPSNNWRIDKKAFTGLLKNNPPINDFYILGKAPLNLVFDLDSLEVSISKCLAKVKKQNHANLVIHPRLDYQDLENIIYSQIGNFCERIFSNRFLVEDANTVLFINFKLERNLSVPAHLVQEVVNQINNQKLM